LAITRVLDNVLDRVLEYSIAAGEVAKASILTLGHQSPSCSFGAVYKVGCEVWVCAYVLYSW